MKKYKNLIFTILLTIVLYVGNVDASSLTYEGNNSISAGETFTVRVKINSVTDLKAIEFNANYNSDLLELKESKLLGDWGGVISKKIGVLYAPNGNLTSTATFTGSSEMVSLTFQAKSAFHEGTSTKLSFENIKAAKLDESAISVSGADFTIECVEQEIDVYLTNLTMTDGTLTPSFDRKITSYEAVVETGSVYIDATAEDGWTIEGLGEIPLEYGENNLQVVVKAGTKSSKTYNLKITRNKPSVIVKNEDDTARLLIKMEPNPDFTNYQLKVENKTSDTSDDSKNAIEKEMKKTFLALYDISVIDLTDGRNEEVKMDNGEYTIRIKMTDEMKKYKDFEAFYIGSDDKVEKFSASADNDYITFNTTHLSKYGFVGNLKESNKINEGPQTADRLFIYIGGIILFIGGGLLAVKKLNKIKNI